LHSYQGAKLRGWQKAALGMGAESPQPEAERRVRTCSVQPDPKGNALKEISSVGENWAGMGRFDG
jgi:hypothetical protein